MKSNVAVLISGSVTPAGGSYPPAPSGFNRAWEPKSKTNSSFGSSKLLSSTPQPVVEPFTPPATIDDELRAPVVNQVLKLKLPLVLKPDKTAKCWVPATLSRT